MDKETKGVVVGIAVAVIGVHLIGFAIQSSNIKNRIKRWDQNASLIVNLKQIISGKETNATSRGSGGGYRLNPPPVNATLKIQPSESNATGAANDLCSTTTPEEMQKLFWSDNPAPPTNGGKPLSPAQLAEMCGKVEKLF
jgi:hypothetical protein